MNALETWRASMVRQSSQIDATLCFYLPYFVYYPTELTNVKKGPLVRIGPNELLSTDPKVIRHMAAVRGSYTKGGFYLSGRMTPGVDNVVSQRDEVKHKAMRAQIAPGVSDKRKKQ